MLAQLFNTFFIGYFMKKITFLLTLATLVSTFMNMAFAEINLAELEAKLKGEGLQGEIHGSVTAAKLFVLTYRNPNDFFDNIQMPLTSESPEILSALNQIKRHQFYIIKGEFITNKAPIKHINITSMQLAKDYASELDHMPYQYKGDVKELNSKTEFIGRVHAMGEQGKMLVMEYKDRIIPVFVTEASQQAFVTTLYRGDLVKIKFRVRTEPEAPTHLSLIASQSLPANEKPIELLESLVKSHGSPIEKVGNLIKFSKSPQINTNIYALLVNDPEGTTIQYTLTNFDSPELFKLVREKLEKIWDENSAGAENDRNKLVNRKLVVHAKGISNMVNAGQANPQILINSLDDISVEILK
jgi:hypothetical protein